MINIGIVEDKESELDNIKRGFYGYYRGDCGFQDYIIDEYGEKEELVNKILDDILNTRIDVLVVDYLISREGFKIVGNEVYESDLFKISPLSFLHNTLTILKEVKS